MLGLHRLSFVYPAGSYPARGLYEEGVEWRAVFAFGSPGSLEWRCA
jgi:hypothetical protein